LPIAVDDLLRDVPALRDPALPRPEAVALVRDWAYGRVVAGSFAAILDHHRPGITLDEIHGAMQERRDGVKCAGAAVFLMLLLRALGQEAYAVNMGHPPSGGTHVVNVVPVPGDAGLVFTIQDCYLNLTIVDGAGAPLDYREVVAAARAGAHGRLATRRGRTVERWTMFRDRDDLEASRTADPMAERLARLGGAAVAETAPSGRLLFRTDGYAPQTYERDPLFHDQYQRWVHERLGRMHLVDYLLFPLGTSGEAAIEAIVFPGNGAAGG